MLDEPRTTKRKITEIIKERTGMDIKIRTGHRHYTFYSDDEDIAFRLSGWHTTTIDSDGLWCYTNETWADIFVRMMKYGEKGL